MRNSGRKAALNAKYPNPPRTQSLSQILAVDRLADEIYRMRLHNPEIARYASAGQFVNLRVHSSVIPLLRRPFSICRRDREAGWFEVLWKVIGYGTRIMAERRSGETMDLIGPLGRPFEMAPPSSLALLVGGGLGVAPLPFLCQELLEASVNVEVFLGARTTDELTCVDLFRGMGVTPILSTDDGSTGNRGVVTQAVERRLRELLDPGHVWIYGCGPVPMLARVDEMALSSGLQGQVSTETMMGCGIGICMGCAERSRGGLPGGGRYKLSCIDGPVFDVGEVVLNG